MTEVEPSARVSRSRLVALRVDELRDLAATLGIGRVSTMRKGTLVDAINDRYDDLNGLATGTAVQDEPAPDQQARQDQAPDQQAPPAVEVPVPDQPAQPEPAAAAGAAAAPPAEQTDVVIEDAPAEDGPTDEPPTQDAGADEAPAEDGSADEALAEDTSAEEASAEDAAATESAVPSVDEQEGGADIPDALAESAGRGEPRSAADHVNAGLTGIAEDLQELQREQGSEPAEPDAESAEGERQGSRRGRGRGRGRGIQNGAQNGAQNGGAQNGAQNGGQQAPAAEPQAEPEAPAQPQQGGRQGAQQNPQNQGNAQQDGESRRGRYRDRKRRGAGNEWDEPEVRDDDVLIPIAGILDVLENYAFVRTSGYLSGANDVYVSLGQVKKYHLRKGDAVVGAIRQNPEGDGGQRQKYNALVKVDSINGLPVAESEGRVEFEQLTPLYPQERLRLETDAQKLSTRVIDLFAPVGKGQRGLVLSPAKAGKTLLLQSVANAITKNNPEVHLMVVLVDERPEEVTDMQRTVKGEVIASTFDRDPLDHTTVAELAIERAKRLVELGYDVVVLLDSLTRLSRAYNQTVPQSGRVLAGGIDPAALHAPKRFFGAARNIENGGSLTILATALVDTGSKADEAILEEFAGTANAELRLDGVLAEKRVFPAVDLLASATRREEMLMGPDEVKVTWQLRRALAGLEPQAALETVLEKLRETGSNVEFLVQMQKSLPSSK